MTQNDAHNLSYSLQENRKKATTVSYEDLLEEVDTLDEQIPEIINDEYIYDNDTMLGMDDYIASELDYQTNYIKKDLERIADYYEISKRKKTQRSIGRRYSII